MNEKIMHRKKQKENQKPVFNSIQSKLTKSLEHALENHKVKMHTPDMQVLMYKKNLQKQIHQKQFTYDPKNLLQNQKGQHQILNNEFFDKQFQNCNQSIQDQQSFNFLNSSRQRAYSVSHKNKYDFDQLAIQNIEIKPWEKTSQNEEIEGDDLFEMQQQE